MSVKRPQNTSDKMYSAQHVMKLVDETATTVAKVGRAGVRSIAGDLSSVYRDYEEVSLQLESAVAAAHMDREKVVKLTEERDSLRAQLAAHEKKGGADDAEYEQIMGEIMNEVAIAKRNHEARKAKNAALMKSLH